MEHDRKQNYNMHYYKRNIGDYAKKTGRLSMLQHGAYNLLIDAIYDREQFPTREQAIEWTWALTDDEIAAVDFVLSRFFVEEDEIYTQKRIFEEIEDYRSKAAKNAENGKRGGRPKKANKTQQKPSGLPVGTESEAKKSDSGLTNNHKPITNNQDKNLPAARAAKYSDEDFRLAEWMYSILLQRNPNHKKPNLETWAIDIRKAREIDKRSHRDLACIFQWAQNDQFWQSNILSAKKLRDQFDALFMKASAQQNQSTPNQDQGFIDKHTDSSWADDLD